jgi:hypothetical protein
MFDLMAQAKLVCIYIIHNLSISARLHNYLTFNYRFAAATQQESEDDEEIPIPKSCKSATLPLPIPGNLCKHSANHQSIDDHYPFTSTIHA